MKCRKFNLRNTRLTEKKFQEGKLYRCIQCEVGGEEWIGSLSFVEGDKHFGVKQNIVHVGIGQFYGSSFLFQEATDIKEINGLKAYSQSPFKRKFN